MMKRTFIFLFLGIFLLSLVSASEVIVSEQPKEIYNYGDVVEIPIKIIASEDLQSSFKMDLFCNGVETNVRSQDIVLFTGEEEVIKPIIILSKSKVERPGNCVVKVTLGSDISVLTNEFEVSNFISVDLENYGTETLPGNPIVVEGSALKSNGKNVQGKVVLRIAEDNQTLFEKVDSVRNGYFFINFSFPKETASKQYLVEVNVLEADSEGQTTNEGFVNYNLYVGQVPTNLEIVFDKKPVEPGTNLKFKTILHDQTGKPIDSLSEIKIINSEDEIIEQAEKETGSFIEFPILHNELSSEWKVLATSSGLSSEETFNITQKEDVEIILVNKTITLVNVGNVPYCNKSTFVKIGNESVKIDICLGVDEEERYILTAPDGKYEVNILTEGEEKISGNVLLTGRAISVKESSEGNFWRYSIMWIFMIAILGFAAYIFFKRGYKKSFFGYITKKKEKSNQVSVNLSKDSLLKTRNRAELSLSIKGEKQNISLVCLKVKDLKELVSKKTGSEETLQKIVDLAEESKASVYENHNNLIFLIAPVKTRTFKNERTAVELAYKIESLLKHHNRMMKDKIDFGISLNYGTIIGKLEGGSTLKFMSMGTLITNSKKIANISGGEVLLSDKINDRLRAELKTEKETHGNTIAYHIKEVRNREDHKNFLANFVKRLEEEKKSKSEKK